MRRRPFATSASAWLPLACALIPCVFVTGADGQTASTPVTDNADRASCLNEGRLAKQATATAGRTFASRSVGDWIAAWPHNNPSTGTGAASRGFTCQEEGP